MSDFRLVFILDSTGMASKGAATVDYFSQMLEYTTLVKSIVDEVAKDIEIFVQTELERFNGHRSIPLVIIIVLAVMVPIIIYVTYMATTSMFKYIYILY
jgi:hypothetical protein